MEGNNKEMCEALVKIYNEVRSYCADYGAGESHESLVDRTVNDPPDYTSYRDSILEIDRIVEAALAAPQRNCNVGTIDEQYKRFKNFCRTHQFISDDSEDGFPPVYVCSNESCPLHNYYIAHNEDHCELAWAQLPYIKGGVK